MLFSFLCIVLLDFLVFGISIWRSTYQHSDTVYCATGPVIHPCHLEYKISGRMIMCVLWKLTFSFTVITALSCELHLGSNFN